MLARLTFWFSLLFVPIAALAQPVAEHVPSDAMIYVGWKGGADLGPGYA